MVTKAFDPRDLYLHIPVHSGTPDDAFYIEVEADGVSRNEFLIGVSAPGEMTDYYVALDMGRYHAGTVRLICREEKARDDLFEGVIAGGRIQERPDLYPDLYHEEIRQQVHFSPARGWMNDPNGLFFKDGVFHMYFQHNPLCNHHFQTNCSWGHAQTVDGIHFTECGDAIMPQNSRSHVASGSCTVDENNISGMGKGTVLAVYSDLRSHQYHGRQKVICGEGQILLYSTDDGMTFSRFDCNPIIPPTICSAWADQQRDPKIVQLDEEHLVIAVYERFRDQDCIGFYRSSDCRTWTFCSRIVPFFECPDLFKLKVVNEDRELWVVYGASGKYSIGLFENYCFSPIEENLYIDYGDCVYAGQTFNNYGNGKKRLYTAWLRDPDTDWDFDPAEPNRRYGFSQSMALFTELTVVRTPNGYRLFRRPIAALASLRGEETQGTTGGEIPLPVPSETVFALRSDRDLSVDVGGVGFSYTAEGRRIRTTSGKEYTVCTPGDLEVRLVKDRRSVELYLSGEVAMSFFIKGDLPLKVVGNGEFSYKQYCLHSIWP